MTSKRLKVLLVEDNPADARLIQESLAEAGDQSFDLEISETLGLGLQRLHLGGIDAMLLDLALPDSYGLETFARAKAQALGVAIIVLTGLNDDSLALRLVQRGAQDFVAKVEVSGNNLTRAILYAVERERLELEFKKLNLELEQRVKERTAQLEASNRDLEAFSFSVSHDLRSPLVNLIGFADLLATKLGSQMDAQASKYLTRIHEAAFKMSHLIDDMLRLAKVGQQGLTRRAVSLPSVIEEVIVELGAEIDKHKIDWLIATLPVVNCDPGLIKQVFANLISNAIKYSKTRENAVIEIGQITGNGQPVFFVRDNGVGFDMKLADKLFAPFQRLHREQEFEGSGIGLATVQRIVEKHRGRVWAESQSGSGSTFFFTLDEESVPSPADRIAGPVLV